MNPIPYGRQLIDQEDIDAIVETLTSDFLTQGPRVEEFEREFAKYVEADYAIAVSNGTAALHLSAMAVGIKEGNRVITTPITFAASANCIEYCGAEVDFVDINPDTYLISIGEIKKKLESSPKGTYKAIIIVDFAGLSVITEELKILADGYNLKIIEDACHAPGAYYINSSSNKVNVGNGKYSDLTCFSFHPVKHIATGEGGMITTNNEVLYEKIKLLRTHGITKNKMSKNHGGWYYEMHALGFNYRISDINCALGLSQLKKADLGLSRRQKIAQKYIQSFRENKNIKFQKCFENVYNAYHLFVIEVEDRKGLYEYLRANNIFSQVHYIPVHLHPYYKNKGWKKGDFPNAEKYYEHCISLPMFPSLTEGEQDYVIQKVIEFVNE